MLFRDSSNVEQDGFIKRYDYTAGNVHDSRVFELKKLILFINKCSIEITNLYTMVKTKIGSVLVFNSVF